MAFLASHQPCHSCVAPNFPKMGFRYPNLAFSASISTKKALKVYYRVSSPKYFLRKRCNAVNYLSNDVNILAGDDPFPLEFGPKGTHPDSKDAHFAFHMRHAVQSALQTFLLLIVLAFHVRPCHHNDHHLYLLQLQTFCLINLSF